MSLLHDVALLESQRQVVCHVDLLLHEVDSQNFLCDRVLHLKSGIHFEEIEMTFVIDKELYGSCSGVVHSLSCEYGFLAHFFSQGRSHHWRRAFLHDFLMTALYGAFSLAEMYYVSEIIAKYLELDVVRILYVLLDVQSSVVE